MPGRAKHAILERLIRVVHPLVTAAALTAAVVAYFPAHQYAPFGAWPTQHVTSSQPIPIDGPDPIVEVTATRCMREKAYVYGDFTWYGLNPRTGRRTTEPGEIKLGRPLDKGCATTLFGNHVRAPVIADVHNGYTIWFVSGKSFADHDGQTAKVVWQTTTFVLSA